MNPVSKIFIISAVVISAANFIIEIPSYYPPLMIIIDYLIEIDNKISKNQN